MKKYSVLLFLVLANLFWAGNYVFGQYLVVEMSPLQMTFFRWLIAVFLLVPLAHYIERPNWKSVWKEWKTLLMLAVLGIISYNFLLYEALQYTTSLNAALVNSINPAVIVLFSVLFLKEKIKFKNMMGLIISLLGVLLVLTKGQLHLIFHNNYNQGDMLMIFAIIVWSIYSIIGRKIKTIPPIASTSVSVIFALLLLLPVIAVNGSDFNFNLSHQAMIGIVYMGVFPSVGSFIFWNISLRHIDASKAGIYLNLITVFTAIISLILGKSISIVQFVGGVLVFIGVYLTNMKERERRKTVEQVPVETYK
ncbi:MULTISPECIES: DMT family transporter [Bacillaceae]|uniref:DMT family transporter n=1 Tax=Bacillaceae TaxID=186817 RepID=UPI000BFBEB8A|nr:MULTISPECIES: DMT family transporter [Bacillaceae]PGT77355.1 EamA family transporter [Bacillus sp. AFS040349]UGB28845.1 DMT family transporter [Metabacillus sp. B2-18]